MQYIMKLYQKDVSVYCIKNGCNISVKDWSIYYVC